MYFILFTLALCLAASARPAPKNRQSEVTSRQSGITPADVPFCSFDDFNNCPAGLFCLLLPLSNSQTDDFLGCATLQDQTNLFADAFGGIENIPHDR
ncbi:hypothetical protein MVEN_00670700 [Mycena venus]|uniref:Uncharacterized protein n=1 Tax=Mycena venus TaxID=2733690 RepID=A0A8H6YQY1_9AGAR|nr:hypothetical protein MVEN_00670700 [Mycena venus]